MSTSEEAQNAVPCPKLKLRLEVVNAWNPELAALLQRLWQYGVNGIHELGLRALVDEFLQERVPVQFYLEPASHSGKHHPTWQNREHGTLLSIVESCVLVPPMAVAVPALVDRNRQPISLAVDVALAATLISDTFKVDDDGKPTKAQHGRCAAEAWTEFALARRRTYPEIVKRAAEASFWHYGIFSPEWIEGTVFSPETQLVHIVDLATSLKALEIIYDSRKPRG
jgi:hypothetical protein